jgi:hypothetical protein
MRKLSLPIIVATLGALLSGVVYAYIPVDGTALLSCSGRSGGLATRKSNVHVTPGDLSATPEPAAPGVGGSTDARNFYASSCTSRRVVGYEASKPLEADAAITVPFSSAGYGVTVTLEGGQSYTGTLAASIIPTAPDSGGCRSETYSVRIVGGVPASATSEIVMLNGTPAHACTFKLIISSNGVGAFDGFLRAAV